MSCYSDSGRLRYCKKKACDWGKRGEESHQKKIFESLEIEQCKNFPNDFLAILKGPNEKVTKKGA